MTKKHSKRHVVTKRKGSSCDELLSLLNEYVDGNVDPAMCKEFEGHLANCNPCRVVVDNVRKTIRLYQRDKPCALPASFRKRLHACLQKHWNKGKP
ncbi:MAG: hypothetical protein A2283_13070 [Lentisphaerae bacterium RIFOXYA12_FULL_48_11]|nr:MAG: hypothetical protein A2283_13070 [Lentisphaerae bacterium RIFOXYA12_FULL_48_11]